MKLLRVGEKNKEIPAVLDKENKLIEEISLPEIIEMIKNETITEGMIPKINACLDAELHQYSIQVQQQWCLSIFQK